MFPSNSEIRGYPRQIYVFICQSKYEQTEKRERMRYTVTISMYGFTRGLYGFNDENVVLVDRFKQTIHKY